MTENLSVMAKTDAERKAEQRARARAAGLCSMCCKRKARKGKTTCKECYEDAKERLYRNREAQK